MAFAAKTVLAQRFGIAHSASGAWALRVKCSGASDIVRAPHCCANRWEGNSPLKSELDHIAVEQFDQYVLWAAHKGDAHAGADRLRLRRELRALRLQFGADLVDVVDPEPDMVEPDKTVLRLFGQVGAVRHLGDEVVDPGQPDIGALDTVRHHRADDLRAEHLRVPRGGRVRVRAAQVDMVVAKLGHRRSPVSYVIARRGAPKQSRLALASL